jgi:hypothetical protein
MSPRQITRFAMARILNRLCTTGVDFHPSRKKNVENKCIYEYLRPYRKYRCHSADFPATLTPVKTFRIYGHSASSDTAERCCTSNSVLRAHAQTETRIYWKGQKNTSPTALPVPYRNLKNEWIGSENFPRPVLTFICPRATTLSYDVAHRTVRS